MYEPDHYFPIMRWKDAEKGALERLSQGAKEKITPLIELVPKSLKIKKTKNDNVVSLFETDPADVKKLSLQKTINEIAATYFPHKIYVDLKYLKSHKIWKFSVPNNIILTIGFGNPHEDIIKDALQTSPNGLCLRLGKDDIESTFFQPRFDRLMRSLGLPKSSIDLLIDLGVTPRSASLLELLNKIPELDQWRTLILSSGSFPVDLTGLTRNSIETLPRKEWLYWREQTKPLPFGIRRPLYGDYTIIHPNYEPPKGGIPSCSIRYTGDDIYVVMRGEQVRAGGPGHEQYNAYAQLLSEHEEFCGENYSEGDAYIYSIGQQESQHGNATTWLRASINHHLTHAVHQLSNIYGTEAPPLLPVLKNSNPLF
jgi:hypothetical protein